MATICCQDIIFPNIQAILFDKDGTLARSESFLRNLAQRRSRLIDAKIPGVQAPLLMAFGVMEDNQLNPAGLMAVGTRWENEIAAAAYVAETGKSWVESLTIARSAFVESDNYTESKASQTPLLDGALSLLQRLVESKLKVGILSADCTSQVQEFVQTYNLEHLIHWFAGVDGYASKSDATLLESAFTGLNVSPDQTLMVGDSLLDVQIAQMMNMAGCIGVTGGWTMPIHLAGATAIVNHFDQVLISHQSL